MAYSLLLLLMGLPIFTHGFGFQVLPFQMDVQVPPFQSFPQSVFPSMNLMSFPPVFNPLEAMGREADAEARGMDVDSPMGNVTTKNKTESKDGFKVTTITSDGPGFHSYIKEYESEGNSTEKNGTSKGPGKMPTGANIFDIMNQLRMGMEKKQRKCKKCGAEKFCDPIFHLCRKKFAEGRTCMAQKQCGKNLRCQWGKCQKAKRGDPGTFCKGNSQCSGDSCCRNTPGSFHLMCIPQQEEGAICGLHERTESIAKVFYVVKRSIAPQCSPCKTGLKCAETGGSRFKRCARKGYVEKASDKLEDDNPSNAISDDDEGSSDDDKETPGDEANPLKGIPPSLQGPTASKNPIDGDNEDPNTDKEDEDDKDKDDEDDKDKEDKGDKDDDEDDDDDDKDEKKKNKEISNGDGMDIQVPKKKKGKGKSRKEKGKDKSKFF